MVAGGQDLALLAWGWEDSQECVGATVAPSTECCSVCSGIGKGKVREGADRNSPSKNNFS